MEYLIIILVCFFSSVVGAICGIGGGVIIKIGRASCRERVSASV